MVSKYFEMCILLEVRVMGKIQKLFSYMILPSEAQPCDLVLHEVAQCLDAGPPLAFVCVSLLS